MLLTRLYLRNYRVFEEPLDLQLPPDLGAAVSWSLENPLVVQMRDSMAEKVTRVNQTTKELERTEDLTNWYGIARGITNLQVQYRTVSGTAANPINSVSSAPADRTTIRSATITVSAETPDLPPGNKGYRQAVQTF